MSPGKLNIRPRAVKRRVPRLSLSLILFVSLLLVRKCRLTEQDKEKAPPNPPALIQWIAKNAAFAKVRPDQKLVLLRKWDDSGERLNGVQQLLGALAKMAE